MIYMVGLKLHLLCTVHAVSAFNVPQAVICRFSSSFICVGHFMFLSNHPVMSLSSGKHHYISLLLIYIFRAVTKQGLGCGSFICQLKADILEHCSWGKGEKYLELSVCKVFQRMALSSALIFVAIFFIVTNFSTSFVTTGSGAFSSTNFTSAIKHVIFPLLLRTPTTI